jgi:hypothetical protein
LPLTTPQPSGNKITEMRMAKTASRANGTSSYGESHEDPRLPFPPSSNPPSQDITSQSTDARLARELNSLSIKERERVFAEIHVIMKKLVYSKKTII